MSDHVYRISSNRWLFGEEHRGRNPDRGRPCVRAGFCGRSAGLRWCRRAAMSKTVRSRTIRSSSKSGLRSTTALDRRPRQRPRMAGVS